MPSRSEYGVYGEGTKIKDWKIYNPHLFKIKPFQTEKKCPLCESVVGILYPITVNLCPICAGKVKEHKDVYSRMKRHIDLRGHKCDWCERSSVVWYSVNTRVCHRCTVKLGEIEKRRRMIRRIARKVA